VILFGETGVGKSSVINLMAGSDVAETSSNLEGCTLQATEYSFTLSSPKVLLRVFDTVGLEDSEMDINTFIGAIEKAQKLITSLRNSGGIDLLFCVKAGRFTAAMRRNYHLFYEVLCDSRVPLALVITHLENEVIMESWWDRNQKTFERYGIRTVAHACTTTLPTHVTVYAEKRVQSRRALQKLFHDALDGPNPSYMQDIRNWLVTFIERLLSLLTGGTFLKKRDIMKKLEIYCVLPRGEAQRLAELIVKG
jgi:tRNA U34 5-carboxymethylaminomethyl modifying GTPase MnmE/TrmE